MLWFNSCGCLLRGSGSRVLIEEGMLNRPAASLVRQYFCRYGRGVDYFSAASDLCFCLFYAVFWVNEQKGGDPVTSDFCHRRNELYFMLTLSRSSRVLFAFRTALADFGNAHSIGTKDIFGYQPPPAFRTWEKFFYERNVLNGLHLESLRHPDQRDHLFVRDGASRTHKAIVADTHEATR